MNVLKGSLIIVLLAASAVLSQTAAAQTVLDRMMVPSASATANCKHESVQVQTQTNYREPTAQALMKDYDEDKKAVQDVAKKNGVTAQIKSENYNINSANDFQNGRDNGILYSMNGNVSYMVEPNDKAKDFFNALTNNKIRASMNYSMNDNCVKN